MNNYSASFLSIINPAYRGDSAETDFLKSVVKRRLIDFLPSAHDVTEIFIEDDNSVSGIVLSNDLKLYSFYLKDGLPPKIHVLRKSPGDGLAEGIESGFKPEESYPVAYSFDAESGDSKNIQKAKFLVGRVINPRLNGIKGIPYLKLDLDLLKGVAIAKDDRAYEFSLSRDGFYSYKLIDSTAKQDSDEKDDCKKGIPCGNACVPRGSECEGLLDPGSNAIVRLAFSTLERSEVPSRKEIVSAVAKETIPAIKEFIKDPKGSIERGNQREAMVRQMLEIASGARVPSRAEVAAEGMKKVDEAIEKTKDEARKFVVENEQNINNWIVNIGEAGGGAIGGALVAGPVGAIGGAVAGTLSTRAALSVVKSAKQVRERLSDDEAFRSATKLKKISMAASVQLFQI